MHSDFSLNTIRKERTDDVLSIQCESENGTKKINVIEYPSIFLGVHIGRSSFTNRNILLLDCSGNKYVTVSK